MVSIVEEKQSSSLWLLNTVIFSGDDFALMRVKNGDANRNPVSCGLVRTLYKPCQCAKSVMYDCATGQKLNFK